MSDEETLERAFLHALRKHFKKPGRWNPPQQVPIGETFKVPLGEVREVYVRQTVNLSNINLNGFTLSTGIVGIWQPYEIFLEVIEINGATGAVTNLVNTYDAHLMMKTEGHILTGDDELSSPSEFYVRWRRRFDLET